MNKQEEEALNKTHNLVCCWCRNLDPSYTLSWWMPLLCLQCHSWPLPIYILYSVSPSILPNLWRNKRML